MNIDQLAKTHLTKEAYKFLTNKNGVVTLPIKLLSGSTKLDKAGMINVGLAMLPADAINSYLKPEYRVSTVCPSAIKHGCDKICIGLYSGHYSMINGAAHKAQLKRSLMYHFANEQFSDLLIDELLKTAQHAKNNDTIAYIRLDVFSDNKKYNLSIINRFRSEYKISSKYLDFYDYTKLHTLDIDPNYTLALSVSKRATEIGKLRDQYVSNVQRFKYSSVVVAECDKRKVINSLNINPYLVVIDGDLKDNFSSYNYLEGHTVLVLSSKAASNNKKDEVNDNFALTVDDARMFYDNAFSYQRINLGRFK